MKEYELTPSPNGKDCICNGKHKDKDGNHIEMCCENCEYFYECYPHLLEELQEFSINVKEKRRMKNKALLFETLDNLYQIVAEPLKPTDKEKWKEEVWQRLQAHSDKDFETYIEITKGIIAVDK